MSDGSTATAQLTVMKDALAAYAMLAGRKVDCVVASKDGQVLWSFDGMVEDLAITAGESEGTYNVKMELSCEDDEGGDT